MILGIIGSRSLEPDLSVYMIGQERPEAIISGGAAGVDTVAAEYARAEGIKLTEFKPDYGRYGPAAPHVRNSQIIAHADKMLIFWDGKSRGTRSVIIKCSKKKKPLRVIIL